MKTWPHKKWNPFIQLDRHDGLFVVPPIVVPGRSWHIGAGILAMPWWNLGENKNNEDRILANGMPIVSRSHKPEHLIIPHLNLFKYTPAQINVLIPLLIYNSSSKCVLAVGSVRGTDGPIAVSILRVVGFNLACNDPVSLPTSVVINWGNVEIGFTWGDLFAALFIWATDALTEWVIGKLAEWAGKKIKGLFKKLVDNYFNDVVKAMGEALESFDNLEDLIPKEMPVLQSLVDGVEDILEWPFEEYHEVLVEFAEPIKEQLPTALAEDFSGKVAEAGVDLGMPDGIIDNAGTKIGDWIDGRAELLQ